ncbi:transcription termination factor Rho [Dactylosporangium sp. CA-233914]|uniref:transcription termination factor Rho n=1 Tax=Dactylosporangium sp. CA-233914 TaxID=3239934 RepID=UPI003D900A8B
MSDTTDVTSDVTTDRAPVEADAAEPGATRRRRSGTGLAAMLLPELQSMAASLGISGTARMRKGELVTAIQERQAGESRPAAATTTAAPTRTRASRSAAAAAETRTEAPEAEWPSATEVTEPPVARTPRRATRAAGPPERRVREEAPAEPAAAAAPPVTERAERPSRAERAAERAERAGATERAERTTTERAERTTTERAERAERGERAERAERGERAERAERGERAERNERGDRAERGERAERAERNGGERADRGERGDRADRNQRGGFDDEGDDDGSRRGRRSRFRDRRRGRDRDGAEATGRGGNEPQVSEDDVLVPVAGILDVLDNYAFVRTTGYLSGSNDVYVAMSQVKRYGLRRGDAVTGAVRQPRDGEQRRDKYNPLVRLDTVNGMDPEEAKRRPEFYKLTPLYPQDRLRLETEPHILTTRVIDLVMPIGKGQRALIVSPPKAGKTMVLQAIANAITRNNPECHLMVVLVDERPEEVTDMQRSVKGEVIASTFDRPPTDHTTVAELSVERAKRLVELGHDVVVLLDSITRLGRAYNNASPASGRILSGGIDSTALYPPKRFLGAARNIENGGSLTIIATALVETGSTGDTVIFEEFKGTGNAELKLDRKIADRRIFPAIDIDPSSTRKEEILLAPDELAIVIKLRKVLHALDSQEALNLLLDRLKKTRTNVEFLMQIAQTTPGE